MSQILRVILWGEEIGRLSWDSRRHNAYFIFNPAFVSKGLDVSPLVAPLSSLDTMKPLWGEDAKMYQRLPAFLADSLPDAWGNQLFEFWRTSNRLSPSEVTPLEKLSFIGKRGMGALEFEPETSSTGKNDKVDMGALVSLAQRIFSERENARIMPDESLTMQSLLAVGTSAGGRQPKAIVAINDKTGEIRSGQIGGLEGYTYCIIKFGDEKYCSAELEQTYYELAIDAGIRMMPSRLIEIDGQRHFLTERFDRLNGEKLHTQTLAALCPEADNYEKLMWVCRKLHTPECDCEELFRRMVFNHLMNNTDDHNKNFAFTMDRKGNWRLSPAYDITYIIDVGGFLPCRHHCLYMRAKLADVTKDDLLAFAKDNGIRRAEQIIRAVAESAQKFRAIATRNHVTQEWIGRVETCLRERLADWGFGEAVVCAEFTTADGVTVANAHLEQAYKGNIHLLATIDGEERKNVIRPKSATYDALTSTGLGNVSEEQIKQLVLQTFFYQ
ncbi:MAG: type II toxin-antitoxin system HipA family toxin [Bacteroidaceae bacterium]|nr:type II toxin-antitoxin system HipA family toxin [Bacteroidaceae bacterium]